MPKRKTADVTAEAPIAAEPRKKATAAKPKATAAATHKRTSTTRKSQVVAEAASAAEPLESVPAVPTPRMATHEEIAARAYSYWEARGFQGGSPEDDWFRAQRELTRTV